MIQISGTRFGDIELDEARTIVFPRGLIGFPNSKRYVLLEPRAGSRVGWLQSLDAPELAFPVIDGATVGSQYPDPGPPTLARDAGLDESHLGVLVLVAAKPKQGLTANLLAPLVVDLGKRTGAQVVLDARRFSPTTRVTAFAQESA